MKKVKRLFHCTKPIHVDPILKEGLIPSPWSQVVYLSSKRQGAFDFMKMRMMEEIRDESGKKILGFKSYDKSYVFEISTTQLDWDYFKEGTDHHPLFFQNAGSVYAYYQSIPPSSIVEVWEYDLKTETLKKHGKNPPQYEEHIQMFPTDEELKELLKAKQNT